MKFSYVLIIGFLFFYSCKKKEIITVQTSNPINTTIKELISASGKIEPVTQVKVSPEVSGEITKLLVKEGQEVKKGQLLAVINPDILETQIERAGAQVNQLKAGTLQSKAQLKQLEAQLILAEASLKRNRKLFEEQVISKAELERIESENSALKAQIEGANNAIKASEYNVKGGQASYNEAQKTLNKTRIYAPMSGTVSKLSVEEGERVVGTAQMSGTEMLIIADLTQMQVVVDVNENDIVKIKPNDTAYIEVDAYLNKKFVGLVTEIANSPKSSKGLETSSDQVTSFEVKIKILVDSYQEYLNSDLKTPFRPGMSASCEILTKIVKNTIAVPIASVSSSAQIKKTEEETDNTSKTDQDTPYEFVWVLNKNNRVVKKKVKTGIQNTEYFEVLEGVTLSDNIVVGPYDAINTTLIDSAEVKIDNKDKK